VRFNAVENAKNEPMRETITVELARVCDADALAASLIAQGFAAEIDGCELRVRYADDEADRLKHDVERALGTWVAHERVPLVPTHCGDHSFALRPPGD
jgi:hypothetical protein